MAKKLNKRMVFLDFGLVLVVLSWFWVLFFGVGYGLAWLGLVLVSLGTHVSDQIYTETKKPIGILFYRSKI